MATTKLAFFFLTLSALLEAHNARQLNDGYIIYVRFGRGPPIPAAEVIQMVTGEEELQSPMPSYGRDNPKAPPSPKVAPSEGQSGYGRDKPKAPPSPRGAPSRGQTTYGGDNPKLLAPPSSETADGYGRDEPKAPPSPKVAPSRGQTTYGGENPKLAPPSPEAAESDQEEDVYVYGKPKAPPSRGETTYGGVNRNSNSQTTNGGDDPRTPPIGRDDPRAPTPPQPAEPSRPILKESICIDGGSACSRLSTSAVDGRRIEVRRKLRRLLQTLE